MTRQQQEYVIQQLIDTCWDLNMKWLWKILGETETGIRNLYHGTGVKSLTISMEKKLHEIVDQKIRNLIKIIKFMDKHQSL